MSTEHIVWNIIAGITINRHRFIKQNFIRFRCDYLNFSCNSYLFHRCTPFVDISLNILYNNNWWKSMFWDIANAYGYEIIAIETDKDHIHFLLSYDTTDKVCDIVKIVKQETTYYLWHKYGSLLSKQYWKKKIFWSDGYFACSIGEVSSATIQKYIENQG